MIGLEIVIGALVTIIVQVLKKLIGKVGSDWTILIVFGLTIIGAILFNIGKSYITIDIWKSWGVIVGSQFTIWAVFIKYIWPKIKPTDNSQPPQA